MAPLLPRQAESTTDRPFSRGRREVAVDQENLVRGNVQSLLGEVVDLPNAHTQPLSGMERCGCVGRWGACHEETLVRPFEYGRGINDYSR